MKKLIVIACFPIYLFGQNTIGLPDVTNYSKQSYGAGLQNWDIKQDKNGIIYVANNEGLLSFDSKYWKLYPLPNKTIVRSIEFGPDNRIYAGGQDEIGYFSPANNGLLQFHSLYDLIPSKDKSFGDVWDIVAYNKNVFFRTNNKIFKFTNNSIVAFDASNEWAYLGICNNQLYACDYKAGLMLFDNDNWKLISNKNELPMEDPVTGIISTGTDSAIITTLKSGLFTLSGSSIVSLPSANNNLFKEARIYAATSINKEWLALASSNNGIFVTDHQGNIVQQFSKSEGMKNNNVLSIFPDKQGNLWLGLDNGIAVIALNSAIKQINPSLQDGSGYTAVIYKNSLFAGTSNGLFSVPLQPMKDLSFSKGVFSSVANSKGQTWGLADINNELLMGHHEGAFVIKDNTAVKIFDKPGFWNFLPLSATFPSSQIIAGNYKGLQLFDYKNGQFAASATIPNFEESSRFVIIDKEGNYWVSQPYHGLYKIYAHTKGNYKIKTYTERDGLPATLNNHVFKIKNDLLIATSSGIFSYNYQRDNFQPAIFYQQILGNQSIRYLKEDPAGNVWFIHEKTLGVIDFSAKDPVIIYLPELSSKLLSGFEFIYPVNDNNIFLGGEKGFFHINYEKYKQQLPVLQAQIRTVRIAGTVDSLLFGGYFNEVNDNQQQPEGSFPSISHSWKAIHFEFASPLFGYQANLEYSFRLKGFEDKWSEWTARIEKEYTNLGAGSYSFEVKVRSNLGNASAPAIYSFKVMPPWYSTWWACFFYCLLASMGIFTIIKWQQQRFTRQQEKHEKEEKKLRYIHDLELSKTESELTVLKNEKLEAELSFTNSELASSAMHLVKKGELLTGIKERLTQVMKNIDNTQANTELKKLIKSLSEDDNMDKEWDSFAKSFDKVHSDFVVHLKEKHPGITPGELKLCAYLRMNLSTKEIAQLLNISVRGVEISRYRLRKKLQLPTEISLFDYLITIHVKENG